MFGLTIVSQRYLEMLDKELAYYREKAEQEQRRADRLHDQLLASNGWEPTTETVRQEQKEDASERDAQFKQHQQNLIEMFAESLDDFGEEGLELPAELQEDAKKMIEETLQPGNAALASFKKK